MVQLSQAPFHRPSSPSGRSEEGEEKRMKAAKQQVTPTGESPAPASPLQSALSTAASPSQAYETYIDNGLICLKHKIRNIEKKKLKLEDYKDRLKKGETLNQDQLEAVEKYDEVVHNLEFAKELQKTFSGLSQDLLKAQKKAQRRESLLKLEAEKKKLRTILQVQYVLQNFTQEHVQKDFKGGVNGAIYLPSKELDYLIRFAKLTCPERNENLRVEDQMEQSSLYFWDLLEGSEKPVVGTTYKHMKDLLSKLLDSGYFESIPTPRTTMPVKELEEVNRKPEKTRQLSKGESAKEPESIMELMKSEIQPQEFLNRRYLPEAEYSVKKKPEEPRSWEAECAKKQEPPKSWEMLVDIKEQEQKQETLKLWEARAKEEEQKRQSAKSWETRVEEEQQKKLEAPKAWVARVREEQESPKPWVAKVREEQDLKKQESPKPWVTKVREEQEQKKQESSKPWVTKVKEEPEEKQESPKPWVTQTREQPEQKKPDPMKTWEVPVREEQQQVSSPQLQNPPKSWAAASMGPKEQMGPKKFDMEPKEVPKPVHQPAAEFCSTSTLPKDPVLRREKLQDLMTKIQGTYNFMQESILDFDKASPSAIGSSQPPSVTPASSPVASKEQKLPSQSDFLQQPLKAAASSMVLHGSNTSLASADHALSGSETEDLVTPQVFKVNAPLPPRKDQEVKEDSLSAGYNQSFSTASTQTPPQCQLQSSHAAEQTSLSQESLSSVNYQPDGPVPVSNGSFAFYPAQANVIPRPPQPYLNSRGSVRGSARGGRSLANSYRSPGGYKGFDVYRGSPSLTNGNYGQLQFPGRDYAGMPYSQRDVNYQQCYKRGGISSGPRANSRAGWSDSSQVSSPERDNETFNSGDSGQGDSRSITPVDMPVTSQAATILPVHVYPLPQQMRVAFSAARTSNLAPGTLDQPIVFDLLLNNLGETFDIQLGRFNCPVNGTYVFIFHMLKLAVNVPLYVNLMKNEEVLVSAYANDGAPDHETASNHAVLQLFQGDQIWLRLHRGAIYGSSWKYSTFSGYLLYQD
ncbi:PREDICTED: caprin-2 isoform X2 [Pseudopodoces humilis]|uniref:caprin-2 isoform X2 n=1 Tax=Pseudopodoces humilis TaxID=181119 RepID=UPI000395664B|nr:PREDICTED: caprin-2 isoform X2 [Pseudopodoces humilis]